jgi:hypothetical protein
MAEQAVPRWREFESQLVARALRDEAFARELRANPRGTIERELGRLQPGAKLPEHVEIRVVEESPTTMYLVLPARPGGPEPLSDEDLEAAAGGRPLSCGKDSSANCTD